MPIDTKYAPYAKETAMCVDLAYATMENDLRAELEAANIETRDVLARLLSKLVDRRDVLIEFTRLTTRAA